MELERGELVRLGHTNFHVHVHCCSENHGPITPSSIPATPTSRAPYRPLEVVHLLLCPQPYHLAGVHLAEAVLEAVVVLDVAVPVPELVEGGLEDFEGTL